MRTISIHFAPEQDESERRRILDAVMSALGHVPAVVCFEGDARVLRALAEGLLCLVDTSGAIEVGVPGGTVTVNPGDDLEELVSRLQGR